jgi:hypothetical protein
MTRCRLNWNYFSRRKGLKFAVTLNAVIKLDCTEAGGMWRNKGPCAAPTCVLSGYYIKAAQRDVLHEDGLFMFFCSAYFSIYDLFQVFFLFILIFIPISILLYLIPSLPSSGARCWWRSLLRHCATNRKVAGSFPSGVIGIFHWHNSAGLTVALSSTQPLTEMSTRNISWG